MFQFGMTNKTKVLILGDLILDKYIHGQVNRISPEAPVPVLLQSSEKSVLGGAGNVANNIRSLGGEAYLVGLLGNDSAGQEFQAEAELLGVQLRAVIDQGRRTTVKTRFMGERQQLLRLDSEDSEEISQNSATSLLEEIYFLVKHVDAVIISDYRKGTLTISILQETIALAKKFKIPVLIDPKGNDYTPYIGADYIKPNRNELSLLTKINCQNNENVEKAAAYLSRETKSNILVTLSHDGMVLYNRNGNNFSISTIAKEVYDVSGAGDTAIAAFTFALINNEPPENAVRFANIASGIAVTKLGTSAVSLEEIIQEANRIHDHDNKRNRGHSDIAHAVIVRDEWRKNGYKVGFTNGCFDLLHPGHISLLRSSATECDRLIVAINSDKSVKRLKGASRPIQDEQSRAEILNAIFCVDLVIIFDEDTPLEVIKQLTPDVLIKGSDYEERNIIGADFVKGNGGRVLRVQLVSGHSTTNLVKRSMMNS